MLAGRLYCGRWKDAAAAGAAPALKMISRDFWISSGIGGGVGK